MHPPGTPGCHATPAASRDASSAVHGRHVLPDTNAHGRGEAPQWLYTVGFDGAELWGRDADPALTVSIDAWESYLEPA